MLNKAGEIIIYSLFCEDGSDGNLAAKYVAE
jgi:hypothetical protein